MVKSDRGNYEWREKRRESKRSAITQVYSNMTNDRHEYRGNQHIAPTPRNTRVTHGNEGKAH